MSFLAQLALIGWLPVVMLFFIALPPRKAVVNSFVIAWLFLPNDGYAISGLPDYTKVTATVIGVLLSVAIFDQARLFSIRFRWFDIPIVTWCAGAFVTTVANGLTPYNGLSLMTVELMNWGLPYLIGRLYLGDEEGLKDLAQAIAIGGLCYIPLCLFEIRFSPILQQTIYGIVRWEGVRFGGFRPKVFLSTGLELGIWMTNATLICYVLWSCGTIKAIRGVSFGALTLAILVTTLLCKSTGAIFLLAVGVVVLWMVRRSRQVWIIWLIVAIPPVYCVARTFDLWSGHEVAQIARATVGEERAQSLEYRLNMERLLADRAREQLILGWGGFNRFQVTDTRGRVVTVPDGFWVIALGVQGLVGLGSMLSLFLLPMILTIRRYPVATWRDPRIGPVVGLAWMLTLTMIDFLGNAMLMPIYPLAIGGLLGLSMARANSGRRELSQSLASATEMAAEGRMVEACREFRRAIDPSSLDGSAEGGRIQAEAYDGLGHTLLAAGQVEEATEAFRQALILRDELAASDPNDGHFHDLAIARDGLSRALAESGRTPEAIEERRIALQIWELLAANRPSESEYRDRRVNTLNDLAWLLATAPDRSIQDPAPALAFAEEAVRISPDLVASWNTLGVARYRAGDWAGAIEALERSAVSSFDGTGTAFDHYFLAMACWRLQREDHAEEWLERGIAWSARHRPGHLALERFRAEAESLFQSQGLSGDLR